MTTSISCRAVLFDMDGTLIDSHSVVTRIWGRFADMFDLDVDEILATSHGVRMIDTVRRHAPAGTDAEAVTAELGVFEIADTDGVVPVAGALEFLASLPADRVALVTSATRELATSRMAAVDLPLPAVDVTAEDIPRGKPAPDCYLEAASRLGVAASECVVFEDAEAGILAGIAAGATVVVVGDWESDATAGLARIRDYTDLSVTAEGDLIRIDWRSGDWKNS